MNERVVAKISSKALRHNFSVLLKMNHGTPLLPMVKADAYGHGAVWVVNTLNPCKGLYGFGVATLEEGIEIRSITKTKKPILVFSDASTWDHKTQTLFTQYQLTPVFSHHTPLQSFLKSNCFLPFEIEINTGMNRLGLNLEDLKKCLPWMKGLEHKATFGVFTHFADAEHPFATLHRKQVREFVRVFEEVERLGFKPHFHTSNSAAIWMNQMKEWKTKRIPILFSRPGLSLYGVRPSPEAKPKSLLRPVMDVSAKVVWIQKIKKGERVGYNGMYQAKKNETLATLSFGYADGLPRILGQQNAPFLIHGKRAFLAGRVSMDLSTIKLPQNSKVKLGDRAEFFGEKIDLWEQAILSNTNPYEILTSLGKRVKREYV